jgi:hypothetical protein
LKGCASRESIEDIIGKNVWKSAQKPIFPFRYFGDFSSMQDLLEATEDKGMPKSSSRVGKAYQAELPEFIDSVMEEKRLAEETMELEDGEASQLPVDVKGKGRWPKAAGKSMSIFNVLDIPGGCFPLREGNELVFIPPPGPIDNAKLQAYFSKAIAVFPKEVNITRSVDIQDRALAELQFANFDYDAAFSVMQRLGWADLGINTWTATEVASFEAGVALYGHDLEYIRKIVCPVNLIKR